MLPLLQGDDLVHTARMEMMDIVSPIKCVVDLLWRRFYHSLEVEVRVKPTPSMRLRGVSRLPCEGNLPSMVDNPLEP